MQLLSAISLFDSMPQAGIDWVIENSDTVNVMPNMLLIREGEVVQDIFLIDSGLFSVYTMRTDGSGLSYEFSHVGPGELIGEMGWLGDQAASASVRALESSVVLKIAYGKVDEKIKSDGVFGLAFLKSIALSGAQRLRRANHYIVSLTVDRNGTQDAPVARSIMERLKAFKCWVVQADAQVEHGQKIEVEIVEGLQLAFRELMKDFDGFMRQTSHSDPIRDEVSAIVQGAVLPYIKLTHVAERFYSKPRGYAGDYHTIELMYINKAGGKGWVGPIVDRLFLDEPAAKAVRNRRRLVSNEILSTIDKVGVAKVTSLACGPAQELRDVFEARPDIKANFTAIDIDGEALDCVHSWSKKSGLTGQVSTIQGNIIYFATGRKSIEIPNQNLVYSIGLIDYFNDKFVIAMLNWIYDILEPGGRVLLGNFHPKNPNKAFMDYVLEWKLIHRDEDDMNRLFLASKFGKPCDRILFEEEGINLFAEGVKS